MSPYTTTVNQLIRAARPDVYRALLTEEMDHQWMVPDEMTCEVMESNRVWADFSASR